MSALAVEVKTGPSGAKLVLAGELTENADFRPALGVHAGPVEIDLRGVTRLNSCGVREWIHFVRALQGRGAALTLVACPVVLVEQLNLITNFAGSAKVQSLFVPTLCLRCRATADVLVELTAGPPAPERLGACARAGCGSELSLDADPARYFAFLEA